MNHPLIQHKLTIIREKECGTKVFREVVSEIAMLMAYEWMSARCGQSRMLAKLAVIWKEEL